MSETTLLENADPETLLQAYTGQWQGMTRTWFEPDKLADESSWQGTIYPILGNRFIQYDYTGSLQGDAFEGKALIGFNAMTKQFEMAWIDSLHQSTGIMYCQGHQTTTGFMVLGSFRASEDGPEWGWRTDFELLNSKQLRIRAYNISPEGMEYLGVETLYTRR